MLLPAFAFAVHQLRYGLAYGANANAALAAQGHGYLDSLAPWLALLGALALGGFLARCARGFAGGAGERPLRSFAALWCTSSAALLLSYALQEWLEGVFAAGHPSGLGGVFGHGGLWAVPLAALAGLLLASLLRLASVVAEIVSVSAPTRRRPGRPARVWRPAPVSPLHPAPLAGRFAGRAPPPPRPLALA
jgi:hypothetical protein